MLELYKHSSLGNSLRMDLVYHNFLLHLDFNSQRGLVR